MPNAEYKRLSPSVLSYHVTKDERTPYNAIRLTKQQTQASSPQNVAGRLMNNDQAHLYSRYNKKCRRTQIAPDLDYRVDSSGSEKKVKPQDTLYLDFEKKTMHNLARNELKKMIQKHKISINRNSKIYNELHGRNITDSTPVSTPGISSHTGGRYRRNMTPAT